LDTGTLPQISVQENWCRYSRSNHPNKKEREMKNMLLKKMRELVRSEEGATATEYAVMLALIIVVAIGAISILGKQVNQTFENVSDNFTEAGIEVAD
jgi:pilus assembly protein Flp/PilA